MFEAFVHWVRKYYQRPEGIIHLHESLITENDYNYIKDCLNSRIVSSVGSYVDQLEQRICKFTNASYAVATINGTSALHISLLLAGVQPGELVITTPFTYVATGNAILYTGADPLFLDIDRQTLGLSPKKLNDFLDKGTFRKSDGHRYHKVSGKRIAACLPVHAFGHPAAMEEITSTCSGFHIPVIEDAAEALGSWYKNKHAGTWGLAGIFSFNGNKLITSGGGGMIVTQHQEFAAQALHLTTQARIKENYGYFHDYLGYNYRMPNLNAALGCAQMDNVDSILQKTAHLTEAYRKFFQPYGVSVIKAPLHADSNYWMQAIMLKSEEERDNFVQYTNEQEVHTRPAWQLLHRFPMFASCFCDELENAEYIEKHVACLPSTVVLVDTTPTPKDVS